MIVSSYRRGTRIISVMLALVFILTQFFFIGAGDKPVLAAPVQGFSDVSSTNPNYAFITYVTKIGVISGFTDGTYRPGAALTRAQAAAIMVNALKLDTDGITASGFRDVPANHWAAKAIGAATKAGLLSGYGNGIFRPDRSLSRAEGISLIFRLTKATIPPTSLPPLQDVATNHWAAPQIAAALDAKMMVLQSEQRFAPDMSMTRGELARALALMLVLAPEFRDQALTCQLTPVTGTVKVKLSGENDYHNASKPETLNPGDSIMTVGDSTARLTFNDGTELRVEAGTELTLKNNLGYKYIKKSGEPGVAVDDLKFNMKSGELFFALASDPNRQQSTDTVKQQSTQITNPGSPNRGAAGRFFRQSTPTPSRAPNTQVAAPGGANTTLPWWKEKQQVKTRLTFDMPVGMCGARSTYGHVAIRSGGWSMNLATGSGVMQVGGRQTSLPAGHEGQVDNRGETRTAVMSPEAIKAWVKAEIAEWVKNTARQIDNATAVQPATATQQQQHPRQPQQPQQQTVLQQLLAALTTMQSGQAPVTQTDDKDDGKPSDDKSGTGGGGGGGGATQKSPAIAAITPSSAEPGKEVVITGSNFGVTQGTGSVSFGSAAAAVTSWNDTSIKVIVPNLTKGSYQVTVKQNNLQSGGVSFTVQEQTVPRPAITSIQPTEALPGSEVVISGSNFGTANGTVLFGSTSATIKSWRNESITVEVPAGLQPGTVKVTVKQGELTSAESTFTVQSITEPPALPQALYGAVTINNSPAPDGTAIVAKVGNQVIGEATVVAGQYGNPAKMVIGASGGIASGQVYFIYVKGIEAKKITFVPGGVIRIDLSV